MFLWKLVSATGFTYCNSDFFFSEFQDVNSQLLVIKSELLDINVVARNKVGIARYKLYNTQLLVYIVILAIAITY